MARPDDGTAPQCVPDQLQRVAWPVIGQDVEQTLRVTLGEEHPQLGSPVALSRHGPILPLAPGSGQR